MNGTSNFSSIASNGGDDESFIVISKSTSSGSESMKTSRLSQFPAMPVTMTHSSFSHLALTTPEIETDEIETKLNAVLEENNYLKQTLYENNAAMKDQFDTLSKWQEAVIDVHKQHKEKFDETKQLIADLRLENVNLKRKLKTFEELELENSSLKNKLEVSSGGNSDTAEGKWNQLVDQLTHQLNLVERARREHLIELENTRKQNQNLQEQLLSTQMQLTEFTTNKDKDVPVLKSFNANSLMKHRDSMGESTELKSLTETARQYEDHIKNLKLFFELQKQRQIQLKTCLKSAINLLSNDETITNVEHLLDRLQQELNDATDEGLVAKFIDGQNQFHQIFYDYQLTKQELQNTRNELDNTLVDLNLSNKNIISLKKDLAASKAEVNEMMKLNDELSDRQQFLKKELTLKQSAPTVSTQDALKLNETIAILQNEIKMKENILEEKNIEIIKLNKSITDSAFQLERIEVFKIQAEEYQKDYLKEKELRIQTQNQKDTIAEDLRLLQRRNQQLIEQVESQIEGYVSSPSPAVTPLASASIYSCPICNKGFRTLRTLEDHLDGCLPDPS